ncbi:MAG: LEPR-XLL domain-containing protein, partial [Planctomycetota bacterium]
MKPAERNRQPLLEPPTTMMKHWLSTTLSRLGIALTRQRRPSRDAPPPVFEPLEPRLLLNGALPMIDRIEADNRGLIDLHVTAFLNPTTVTADAVRVTTAGKDLLFGTADDVQAPLTVSYDDQARRIRIQADVPLDARYRVEVDGDAIRDLFATPLDAEFNGPGLPTGDGTAGGDLVFFTRKASSPTARLLTTAGEIRVELFPQDAPKTVANFIAIANRGDYDGVVFHRLVKDFVAQGGGFQADPLLAPAPAVDPVVNEFKRSNVRGTIAMAKRGNDPNSATNQWF